MMEKRVKYPLWWCITSKAQAALMQFQFDNYGEKLEIPTPPTKGVWLSVETESLEEIDKLMRQTKRHFKGVDVGH